MLAEVNASLFHHRVKTRLHSCVSRSNAQSSFLKLVVYHLLVNVHIPCGTEFVTSSLYRKTYWVRFIGKHKKKNQNIKQIFWWHLAVWFTALLFISHDQKLSSFFPKVFDSMS